MFSDTHVISESKENLSLESNSRNFMLAKVPNWQILETRHKTGKRKKTNKFRKLFKIKIKI